MTTFPDLVLAWLTGRSLARGLPPPVADQGGYRVDTGSAVETCRWIFAARHPGAMNLAQSIEMPGYLLKWFGERDVLAAILPDHWDIDPPAYFMCGPRHAAPAILPPGYHRTLSRSGSVTTVRLWSADEELAASGYAADTPDAFVYDRIVTAPDHRRRGLGRTLMASLGEQKRDMASPALLVATEEGRALYTALGWQTICPYWTAAIVAS